MGARFREGCGGVHGLRPGAVLARRVLAWPVVAYTENWPARLWLVRHGESAGNVARKRAEDSGVSMIDIADRDMDVPLSTLGQKQARALGQRHDALLWLLPAPVRARGHDRSLAPDSESAREVACRERKVL